MPWNPSTEYVIEDKILYTAVKVKKKKTFQVNESLKIFQLIFAEETLHK